MDATRHPSTEALIEGLRPTQMSIGYAEVALKRKEWRARSRKDAQFFLDNHRFPAIVGPGKAYFIIDHHHLGRALLEEQVRVACVAVLSDLSYLDPEEFWIVMDYRRWTHPYDEMGRRRDFSQMPTNLRRLPDDPDRSLAAQVRREDEYPKDTTPFSEFLWADFLRRRISRAEFERDAAAALQLARKLVRRPEAAYLPDWSAIGKN